MPTIVHFEVPIDNPERASKFYGELFGWKFEKWQGPMEYWLITTTNEKGDKGTGGGLVQRKDCHQAMKNSFTNYIGVPSIDEYVAKVQKLGGKIVIPKTAIPTIGYMAVCVDTENNTFAMFEGNPNAK